MSTFRKIIEAEGNRSQLFIDETNLDGKLVVHDLEDCEPYIKEAKRLSEQTPGEEWRHAAIVPHFVYRQAIREGWHNDMKAWGKWANDPDNKAFRTWPGKLRA